MANTVLQQINTEMEELQKQLSQFKSSVEYLNNAKANVTKAVETVNKAEESFNQRVKELHETYHSFIQLSDAVWAVIKKIDTVNFPERLSSIETTVKETIQNLKDVKDATITEVQKAANAINEADFNGRFTKLQKGLDLSVKSSLDLGEGIHKMKIPEKIDEFEKNVAKRISEGYKEVERNTKQIADGTAKLVLDLNIPVRIDKVDANIAGINAGVQNLQGRLDSIERSLGERIKDASDKYLVTLSSIQEKLASEASKNEKSQFINTIITWALLLGGFILLYFLQGK